MFEERYVHFCQPLHFFTAPISALASLGGLQSLIVDWNVFCISQVLLNTIKSYSRLGQTKNKNHFCTSSNPHAMVLTYIPAFFLPHFSSVSVRQGTEGDDNLDEIYTPLWSLDFIGVAWQRFQFLFRMIMTFSSPCEFQLSPGVPHCIGGILVPTYGCTQKITIKSGTNQIARNKPS